MRRKDRSKRPIKANRPRESRPPQNRDGGPPGRGRRRVRDRGPGPEAGLRDEARRSPARPARIEPRPEAGEGLAFGFHAVRTALEQHPRRVERLLLARDLHDARARRLVALARSAGVPFHHAPREALDRLSGGLQHQGVAARLGGAELLTEEELVDRLSPESVVLVLDGIQDPRNLGAILRSAGAFGVDGVFLPGRRAAGLSPAAVRTASGGLEFLSVARAGNLSHLLDALAERGVQPVALSERDGRPPWETVLGTGVALVAGGEERGVRPGVLSRCPKRVWIPVRPEVGALNVSVAVGVVLAEVARQRITKSTNPVNT